MYSFLLALHKNYAVYVSCYFGKRLAKRFPLVLYDDNAMGALRPPIFGMATLWWTFWRFKSAGVQFIAGLFFFHYKLNGNFSLLSSTSEFQSFSQILLISGILQLARDKYSLVRSWLDFP